MSELLVLKDSPYSLPDEAESSIFEMRSRLRRARVGLQDAVEQARRLGLIREIERAHAYWAVFESNRIEFEGPDLAGTVEAIESARGQDVLRELNINLLPDVLKQDRRAFAAIGLETARLLAGRYIGDGSRGFAQIDIRSLHSVLMAGSWFAGAYRSFDAGIADSEHRPFPTYQIDSAMADLADWSQRNHHHEDAVLRAAIGHAWFTHVHPFQDGNGRVARLLTNVLLGQDGLPPAIVKASSQRSQYIAALAHSDEGGDIMPLTGLFLDTVERYVDELKRPRTFRRLFAELVARRGDNYFAWYQDCVTDFMTRLQGELSLYGLNLEPLDALTPEVFDQMRKSAPNLARDGTSVLTALVRDQTGQEIALYQRVPPLEARNRFRPDERVPGIAFALPNDPFSLSPYRRTTRADLEGLSEIWVQPDRTVQVYVDDAGGVTAFGVAGAAARVAGRLRVAFARRFRTPSNYFGSARWLPKINGGPG